LGIHKSNWIYTPVSISLCCWTQ